MEQNPTQTIGPYTFVLEQNGSIYRCEAEVTGNGVLRQTVKVVGVGSKRDIARYGRPDRHPPEMMPTIARMIAQEILGEDSALT
jgi:hypothetical protein